MSFCKSDLEVIYDYYKNLSSGNIDTSSSAGNSEYVHDNFAYYLIDFYNKNKFPKLATDAIFDEIDKPELYHGFKNYKHGASFLWDFLYHYGEGTYGAGFYTTNDYAEASDYGSFFCCYIEPLKIKLDSDKIIDIKQLKLIKDALENDEEDISRFCLDSESLEKYHKLRMFIKQKTDGKKFRDFLTRNYSSLAIYLGFDATKNTYKNNNNYHLIILNRGSIVFSKRDFRRFMLGAGGEYKTNYMNHYLEVDEDDRYIK